MAGSLTQENNFFSIRIIAYRLVHQQERGRNGTAVVFLVEMDHAAMMRAPRAPTIRESARQYYRAARIALTATAVWPVS